jgi:hypothetical protein
MPSSSILFALSSRALRNRCPQQLIRDACCRTETNQTVWRRRFSEATGVVRPQQPVTARERMVLRAARKERAAKFLSQGSSEGGASTGRRSRGFVANKYFWYATFIVPSGILVWGLSDENSLPAQFSEFIGLTGFLKTYIDDIAKPSHEKLLPDWSQVRCMFACLFVCWFVCWFDIFCTRLDIDRAG